MSKIKEDHDKERVAALQKIDAAKKEGAEMIALVEMEKQKIVRERADEMNEHHKNMETMTKEYHQKREEIHEVIKNKKLDILKDKR